MSVILQNNHIKGITLISTHFTANIYCEAHLPVTMKESLNTFAVDVTTS